MVNAIGPGDACAPPSWNPFAPESESVALSLTVTLVPVPEVERPNAIVPPASRGTGQAKVPSASGHRNAAANAAGMLKWERAAAGFNQLIVAAAVSNRVGDGGCDRVNVERAIAIGQRPYAAVGKGNCRC